MATLSPSSSTRIGTGVTKSAGTSLFSTRTVTVYVPFAFGERGMSIS